MKLKITTSGVVAVLAVLAAIGAFLIYRITDLRVLQENIGVSKIEVENNVFVRTYPNVTLENLWIAYRDKIQKDGRTIDRSRNYLTTSEGQSYSLLRSVWMDDKETFDRVLKWTTNNLQKREDDELFAWKWGQNSEGRWDVLVEEGGMNSAADADQDIALALIFASKRWNQDHYIKQAREILADIWRQEVLELNGKYYLLAGNWAKTEALPTINPSYFSPAAYPIFAEVDPAHPWMALRDTSYEVLEKVTLGELGAGKSAGLPPDWVNINPRTGELIPVVHSDKDTNFGDDAFRVVWRVGLDYKWFGNERAKIYLENLSFLRDEWTQNQKIYAAYTHKGDKVTDFESYSMYGGVLPYFRILHPEIAEEIYLKKLAPLYNPDIEDFREDVGYYAQNWVWFGIGFYENKLPNLYDAKELGE
ncbi:glycosyl hydrolase [candidate division WWE3 bacterium]|jgi:endoglucanase|uniref:Glycosyl hydrolase n=1 Tax=candidate division WWE3 bacterium TaxID=2053526 RepID=A0A3A4ZGI6_UNCKA|nr:MAG: glycosyl hydrolase [candidate division WWE3 bacterium]